MERTESGGVQCQDFDLAAMDRTAGIARWKAVYSQTRHEKPVWVISSRDAGMFHRMGFFANA